MLKHNRDYEIREVKDMTWNFKRDVQVLQYNILPAKHGGQALVESLILAYVLCWEESRVLANDWTFRFETRLFQVEKQTDLLLAKTSVMVPAYGWLYTSSLQKQACQL